MNKSAEQATDSPSVPSEKAEKVRHDGQQTKEKRKMENKKILSLNENTETIENNASMIYSMPLKQYLTLFNNGEITLPPFQRVGFAWSADKVVALAQTLVNLEAIGTFHVAVVNGKYYLTDGQQRTNAINHIYNSLDEEDKGIVTDYDALINVTEFQNFAQMSDNFVRINGTSGLTSAQKMKAELLTEIQLEDFNRVSWDEDMVKLTSTEKDTTETTIDEEESVKLQAMNIIKQSKCEELTALLLAMYLNKSKINKGFTTSAKTNFNGNKDYKGLKGSDLSEASKDVHTFVKAYSKGVLNPTTKKPAFIGLVYYLVLIDRLPLDEVGAFVKYLTIDQKQLFVTPKSEIYHNGKQLFRSGEANSLEKFKSREKVMDTFFKSFEDWKSKKHPSATCEEFEKFGLRLEKLITAEKAQQAETLKVTIEKPKKESKQRTLSASTLAALEK